MRVFSNPLLKTLFAHLGFFGFATGLLALGWQDVYLDCERKVTSQVSCTIDERFVLGLPRRHVHVVDVVDVDYITHRTRRLGGGGGAGRIMPHTVLTSSLVLIDRQGESTPIMSVSSKGGTRELKTALLGYIHSSRPSYSVTLDDRHWFGYLGALIWVSGLLGLPWAVVKAIRA